ncbi:hypothetical protein FSARC_4779 [Fusarium sarcochroum]|uniref:Uncharacterized protein n=1 Tax=Fusarium sarcochroum TaxID=1208366 RepID=A0A8H4U1E3_9HYPO|nr:hypothetical protein FSARC_4779 [Fusarium sarcochroum]
MEGLVLDLVLVGTNRPAPVPHVRPTPQLSGTNRLDRFLDSHDRRAVSSITQSFTIRVSNSGRTYNNSIPQLAAQLHRFAGEVIVHMSRLESFSLTTKSHRFKLDNLRSAISSILRSLPEGCVNLELDIGAERINDADTDMAVCEDLRRVLPRMHDVRIRMAPVSDAILGTRDPDQIFHSIALPHIRSLLIDCAVYGWEKEREEKEAWYSFIQALQQVAESKEANAAELVVVGCLHFGRTYKYVYSTLSRCNVRSGNRTTTKSFPRISLGQPKDGSHIASLIRTDTGRFVTAGPGLCHDVAGGRPWRSLCTGARLSVSSTPRATWISDGELPIFTEAEWHKKYPERQAHGLQRHNQLLADEKTAGMALIDAEERKGTELRSVMPMTLPGVELKDLVS